jgi:hypothetical protein
MRGLLTGLAALALVMLLVFVGMVTDLSLHGAYVTGDVERFPGAELVATLGSGIAILGLLILLGTTFLDLMLTRQQRQWGWFLVLLTLLPVAMVSVFSAGFHPDVGVAVLALLSPIALLIYSLRAAPEPGGASDASRSGS